MESKKGTRGKRNKVATNAVNDIKIVTSRLSTFEPYTIAISVDNVGEHKSLLKAMEQLVEATNVQGQQYASGSANREGVSLALRMQAHARNYNREHDWEDEDDD